MERIQSSSVCCDTPGFRAGAADCGTRALPRRRAAGRWWRHLLWWGVALGALVSTPKSAPAVCCQCGDGCANSGYCSESPADQAQCATFCSGCSSLEFNACDLCSNGCGNNDESKKEQCQAAKLRESGKYAYCRLKEDRKALQRGELPDYSNCDARFLDKFSGAEDKTCGICTTVGDASTMQNFITACTDEAEEALAGGGPPLCPGGGGGLLQTGQTECDQGAGTLGPCPGSPPDQDGEVLAGTARSYTDNGDGTITDNFTALMWEKLSDDGSIHDKDLTYTWYTAFTTKIAALNSGLGFAGHTDWRLPNRFELETLLDLGRADPAIDPVFNTGCAPGCTVLTCSCTPPWYYWSSTTGQADPPFAWHVWFLDGNVNGSAKGSAQLVRAVRGGYD